MAARPAATRTPTRCTSSRCGSCPTTARIAPGYEQLDIGAELRRAGSCRSRPVRGHDAAISIDQRDAGAVRRAARAGGSRCALPDAPYVHLFVARGAVELEGAGRLAEGDAARLTGVRTARASPARRRRRRRAEILVWEMHSALG